MNATARIGGHSNTVTVPTANRPDRRSIPASSSTMKRPIPISPPCSTISRCRRNARTCRLRSRSAGGDLEYSGNNLVRPVCAKSAICFGPRFWSMLRDLQRFYRRSAARPRRARRIPHHARRLSRCHAYGAAFRDDHLLPMAAAIWSAPHQRDSRLSRGVVHPLPGQSRPAATAQPSAMAHRARRQPRLCRAPDASYRDRIRLATGVTRRAPARRTGRGPRLPRPRRKHSITS